MNNIKILVFDFDGTLYEETHQFQYYAECLKKRLAPEFREKFSNDYACATNNNHPLQIGRVYDVLNKCILLQTPEKIMEVINWDGSTIEKVDFLENYDKPLKIDMERFISVGDDWWLPSTVAQYYGLNKEDVHQAFLETREHMMGPSFIMKPVPGLRETLLQMSQHCKLVLMTNSHEPDCQAMLEKLNLDNSFHMKIFDAQKPMLTNEKLAYISEYFNVSYNQVLSVGDNWLNEIHPARKLGCKTLYINYQKEGNKLLSADHIVNKVREILPILKEIRHSA